MSISSSTERVKKSPGWWNYAASPCAAFPRLTPRPAGETARAVREERAVRVDRGEFSGVLEIRAISVDVDHSNRGNLRCHSLRCDARPSAPHLLREFRRLGERSSTLGWPRGSLTQAGRDRLRSVGCGGAGPQLRKACLPACPSTGTGPCCVYDSGRDLGLAASNRDLSILPPASCCPRLISVDLRKTSREPMAHRGKPP